MTGYTSDSLPNQSKAKAKEQAALITLEKVARELGGEVAAAAIATIVGRYQAALDAGEFKLKG